MLLSCMHLAAKLRELHRLHLAATLSQSIPRQMSSIQGKQTCLVQQSCHSASFLASSQQQTPAVFSGKLEEQAGPNISRLAPHLQQEWDYKANTHLGKIIIAPHSLRKAWWRSGMCKTGQPHRWQARVSDRTNGAGCPYDSGRAVSPCNNLAHNHPEVAAEWDWEANKERTPETVTASSAVEAAWRCGLSGNSWTTGVCHRTKVHGTGCPECAHEARLHRTKQPSISDDHHTCWLTGTGKLMRDVAGTQTKSLWART